MVHFLLSMCAEEEVVFTADPPKLLLPELAPSLSLSQAGLWLEFGEKGRCIVPILNRKTVSIKNLGPQQSLWVVSAGATWTCLGPIKGLTRRPSEIPAKELRRWIRKCLRA